PTRRSSDLLRPIVEDMAEMATAPATMHLDPLHHQRSVAMHTDDLRQRRPEARPARAAIELGLRREERLRAPLAGKDAAAMLAVERAAIGPFSALTAQDVIGRRPQFLPPCGIAHRNGKALRRLGLMATGGQPDADSPQ